MIKIETKIKGAFIIKPIFIDDIRGSFYTSFSRKTYTELGILNTNIVQMNTSISKKNVIRGLHYQSGLNAQAKLLWVSKGKIQDVFVDLREDSPTFGQWDSVNMTNDGNRLFVPKGCAHGFLSLEDDTQVDYLVSNPYNKESERTLIWNDPVREINWNYTDKPIISSKDLNGISFKYCEKYREY